MNSHRSIQMIGRLTKKPELHYTEGGKAVCKFTVAVNDKRDNKPEYFDIVAFDKQAESCSTYLDKGRPVFVMGKPEIRKWEDKAGVKHSKLETILKEITFLGSGNSPNASTSTPQGNSYDEFVPEIEEDDVPL